MFRIEDEVFIGMGIMASIAGEAEDDGKRKASGEVEEGG
jgi:hypothetical protein